MKEFKGTPGTWRLESDEWSDYIISDSPEPPHHGAVICGMDSENENFKHDAHLIAAAPDLLKTLQGMQLSMMAHPDYVSGENQEFIDKVDLAKEVINRALGINS